MLIIWLLTYMMTAEVHRFHLLVSRIQDYRAHFCINRYHALNTHYRLEERKARCRTGVCLGIRQFESMLLDFCALQNVS
jgi:hypothetical protein